MGKSFEEAVAEIITKLGEDDEIYDEIKEKLDLGELISEAMQNDPTVKAAAIRLLVRVIDSIKPDDDIREHVCSSLDFEGPISQELKEDEDVKTAVRAKSKQALLKFKIY